MISFVYFVSYRYKSTGGMGVGRCEISTNERIKSIDDIKEIEKSIEKQFQNPNDDLCCVLNYKFLRFEFNL